MKRLRAIAVAAIVMAGSGATQVGAAAYNVKWTGADDWTLTGMFSFDDGLLGSTLVTEADLDVMMIEIFENGASQGTWDYFADGVDAGADMNFNFNALAGKFRTGGVSNSDDGQRWNACGNVGFASGDSHQRACFGGAERGRITLADGILEVSKKVIPPVPLPAPLLLLAGALGALRLVRRKV